MSDAAPAFDVQRLAGYFRVCLKALPEPYTSLESTLGTAVYFAVGGLDLIDRLDAVPRAEVIDWLYSLQVVPSTRQPDNYAACGFRGGPYLVTKFNPTCVPHESSHPLDEAHIAITYTSLLTLNILGDDLSRVNRKAILGGLRALQAPDGSFAAVRSGSERDVRFSFCAAAIAYMLGGTDVFDVDAAVRYILRCQSYDSAFAPEPNLEGHGAPTYCALAALSLLGRLDALPDRDRLVGWCLHRLSNGYQGRCHKPADSCYSFWIGGALQILGATELVDVGAVRTFNSTCQKSGGFGKWPNVHPDVVHSYLASAGLAIVGTEGFKPVDARLNCSTAVAARIEAARERFASQS